MIQSAKTEADGWTEHCGAAATGQLTSGGTLASHGAPGRGQPKAGRSRAVRVFLLGLTVGGALVIVDAAVPEQAPVPAQIPTAGGGRVGIRRPAIANDGGEMAADAARVRGLLLQERFGELEALAQTWTDTRARNSSGSWRVETFLTGVIPGEGEKNEARWEQFRRLHATWRKQSEEPSPWQVVAEADFWVAYGWQARGKGYADTVTPDGWRLFAERVQQGEGLLTKHWALISGLPSAHSVMGRLALAQGYPRAKRDRLLADAIARWPDYNASYFSFAMYVLPRWHGRPGELAAWAWAVTEGQPEDFRHEIYARVAWSLTSSHRSVIAETGMEWPKIRAGFAVLRKKWPESGHILNRYARFAWQANDRQTARELLALIGDAPVPAAWGTQEVFDQFSAWTRRTP